MDRRIIQRRDTFRDSSAPQKFGIRRGVQVQAELQGRQQTAGIARRRRKAAFSSGAGGQGIVRQTEGRCCRVDAVQLLVKPDRADRRTDLAIGQEAGIPHARGVPEGLAQLEGAACLRNPLKIVQAQPGVQVADGGQGRQGARLRLVVSGQQRDLRGDGAQPPFQIEGRNPGFGPGSQNGQPGDGAVVHHTAPMTEAWANSRSIASRWLGMRDVRPSSSRCRARTPASACAGA